jgi:hypothetical protein
MKETKASLSSKRFPRIRVIVIAVLALAWAASMGFSGTYAFADSEYGFIGDGSDSGYERVRSWGLAYGCVVVQTIHRTRDIGWQRKRLDPHFLPWAIGKNIEGKWTVSTTGFSLLLPIFGLAATTIPCWRRHPLG